MKIDLTKLKEAVAQYKKTTSKSDAPTHEILIPVPDKEFCKANGAKWNNELKRHEFASYSPDTHALAKYQCKNFVELKHAPPFEFREQFRDSGVVTKQVDGVWKSYVMQDEQYAELIGILMELELL